MKRLLLASVVAGLLTVNVHADTNMTAHEAFKADLSSNQENYYRSLRVKDWTKMGLLEVDFISTTKRLKPSAGGDLIDSDNPNSPGHWTYEFIKTAEDLELRAGVVKNAASYDRASTAYLVASYPNLHRPNEIYALDKAVDLYIKAAKIRGESVEKVKLNRFDGRSVTGILHLPKVHKDKYPAIMWTGGVDKTLIEHKDDFKSLLESGYAILTFDMPGAGLDYKNHLVLGDEDVSHQAAYNFLFNHPSIDKDRLGVIGSSGSGPSLIKFAMNRPELRAVVARCALVDGPIGHKDKLKFIPKMSADSFIARIGGDPSDFDYFERNAPNFSLQNRGIFDGNVRFNTPLLAINTQKDPVAPPEDVIKTAELSSKSEVHLSHESGHCPDSKEAKDRIDIFLKSNI